MVQNDPFMTFDPKTVDTLVTPSINNACVLMTLLFYLICKDNGFLNIFGFQTRNDPLMTFDPNKKYTLYEALVEHPFY